MMKKILRKFLSQKLINTFWHLPVAFYANIINGFPAGKIKVIGVTGTDGKTTTTNMIYQILKSAGIKVSMVSTINAVIAGKEYDTGFHVTSPHSLMVQKFLKEAVKNKDEVIILETTSMALDQHRFWGVKFDTAVITNITHEHLDYHKNFDNYLNTKAKILKGVRVAILNHDDKNFETLKKRVSGIIVSFGLHKNADFNPYKFPLKLLIPGEYNLLNALAASAVAVNLGVKSEVIKRALFEFRSLNGRMEEIENNLGKKIIIDFAHTPNGLENALKALRKETKGQLISLIGAEGYRDEGKRGMMGEISAKLADKTIVTAVDPRGLINQINKQILQGAAKAGASLDDNIFVENDRQEAINFAINVLAKKGDTIGIFGKGHETSMNMDGLGEAPWNDKEAVLKALKSKHETRNTK